MVCAIPIKRVMPLRCPYCGNTSSKVLESRQTEEGRCIRRRRECISCSERFTTYERIEKIPIYVIKKDGRREPFDPEKILKGLLKACEKRPISVEKLREIVDEIEAEIVNRMETEVPTTVIGEMVMDKLKKVDDVAYVRFASVYREFKDLKMFLEELENLLTSK
ncbi:MAG: Transcriptional repressor NrdR [Clostridia bacterium 41_269]|nr:MAG: Transcriptional repressor NrdR [Clostridia bacterium 41_269]